MSDRRRFLKIMGLAALGHTVAPAFLWNKWSLPVGMAYYRVNGQSVFPVYGEDGGLKLRQVSYLVCTLENGNKYSFCFDPGEMTEKDAVREFTRLLRITEGKAV